MLALSQTITSLLHCYALVLQIDLIQPISEKGLIKRNLNGQTAHIFTHKINEYYSSVHLA